MTVDRASKKAIRERMAATGEPYNTVRRCLEAAAQSATLGGPDASPHGTDPYDDGPDAGDDSACDCHGAWHTRQQHCVDWPCPGCSSICRPEPGIEQAGLPHDDYMDAVDDALTEAGVKPRQWWTETPDGQQLDAVFEFEGDHIDEDEWPDGAYLAWDQHRGWVLIESGGGRNIYDLPFVDAYPNPAAVAAVAKARLAGLPDPEPTLPEEWDQGAATEAAVQTWNEESAA